MQLEAGLTHRICKIVEATDTAARLGSGLLEVLATPAMVALMEQAAMQTVQPCLEQGQGTVGTALSIAHTRATAVGATVCAEATLLKVEGRRLDFEVVAIDEQGEIGRGTHSRFIIDNAKFMSKLNQVK